MTTMRLVPLTPRAQVSPLRRAWLRLKRWHLRRQLAGERDNLEAILAGGLGAEPYWIARHMARLRIDALRIQIDDIGLALGEGLTTKEQG